MSWNPKFGPRWRSRGRVSFRIWSPGSGTASLVLDRIELPMRRGPDGTFGVTADSLSAGDLYRFRLDGDGPFPDPWSRWQPAGVHGPSALLPARLAASGHVAVPRRSAQTTYELHVGTFSRAGTYRAAAARLAALKRLGIDTVQVMPLAEFPGGRNWGYDGAYLYAPTRAYGSPADLKLLTRSAHRAGLAIILDAVYNHLGPDGAYIHRFAPEFFDRHARTPWGGVIDYKLAPVRETVADAARWWIEEYGFDGFRLDAVNTIVDDSRPHILEQIGAAARRGYPRAYIVVEDSRNWAPVVTAQGMDAILSDDFGLSLRARVLGEHNAGRGRFSGSLEELAAVVRDGWLEPAIGASELRAANFVFALENHDQVGHRTDGLRLGALIELPLYRALSALLLLVPERAMLFMGQESAASSPFHFFSDHEPRLGGLVFAGRKRELGRRVPDPQDPETFSVSKLLATAGDQRCRRLYRDLLRLRRSDPVVSRPDRAATECWCAGEVLFLRRSRGSDGRLLAVTLGAGESRNLPLPPGRILLHTQDRRYGGDGDLTLAPACAVLLALPRRQTVKVPTTSRVNSAAR
jgi:maltooligosyltrehalose trehalohydrolase